MGRHTKKLAMLAMLSGIVAVISVADLKGSSSRPAPAPVQPATATTVNPEPEKVILETPLTQTEPAAATSRVSVSFDDGTGNPYALVKGGDSTEKRSRRPDIDVWYGQYSEKDYRVLPASPLEKEPSRLNVKISFAF